MVSSCGDSEAGQASIHGDDAREAIDPNQFGAAKRYMLGQGKGLNRI